MGKKLYWRVRATHQFYYVIMIWTKPLEEDRFIMMVPDLDACTIRRKVRWIYGDEYEICEEKKEKIQNRTTRT